MDCRADKNQRHNATITRACGRVVYTYDHGLYHSTNSTLKRLQHNHYNEQLHSVHINIYGPSLLPSRLPPRTTKDISLSNPNNTHSQHHRRSMQYKIRSPSNRNIYIFINTSISAHNNHTKITKTQRRILKLRTYEKTR